MLCTQRLKLFLSLQYSHKFIMGDEEIIKRRLLIDGDGTGDARMMTKFTRSFIKWCFSDENSQECQMQYDRLLTSLSAIEQSAVKWDKILEMNDLQIQHYADIRSSTLDAVTDAQDALESAKTELAKAREIRNNSLQYHALGKLIQEHPPRSPTAQKLEKLSATLTSLKNMRDQLQEQLLLRKKQLHLLFTALHQLQSTLDIPQEMSNNSSEAPIVDLTDEPPPTSSINTDIYTDMDCTPCS